jgi:hypothetical protein
VRTTTACFIHTPWLELRDDRLEPPLGLLYLATHLNAHGHRTRLCDLSSLDEPDLDSHIPDGLRVYGFSTYSVNYGQTRDLMRSVRMRNPDALFIAGGPHATALPGRPAVPPADRIQNVQRGLLRLAGDDQVEACQAVTGLPRCDRTVWRVHSAL